MSPRKPKRDVPMLSDAEEAALQAQIANDPDAVEATDEQLAQARPAKDVLPPELYRGLTKRGRPRSENKRAHLTLRVDPAVIEAYKAGGPGWQTRMHDVLAQGARLVTLSGRTAPPPENGNAPPKSRRGKVA